MAFQFSRLKALQCLLIVLAVITLSACGFHLREAAKLPFKTIYLGFNGNSSLGAELKRYLRVSGVEVLDSATNADATLQVLNDSREKKILTLTTSGTVGEYSLYQRFTFQVKDNKGEVIIPPAAIVLKRDITYDANAALAKQAEETILYRDMQSDLVQQIIRRLAASKPNSGNAVIEE